MKVQINTRQKIFVSLTIVYVCCASSLCQVWTFIHCTIPSTVRTVLWRIVLTMYRKLLGWFYASDCRHADWYREKNALKTSLLSSRSLSLLWRYLLQ